VNINNLFGPDNKLGGADDGLRLQSNDTVCKDKGDPARLPNPPVDILGVPRGSLPDIGAYEQ
jgi:hypothetical protein